MPQQWIYSNLIFPVWWPCKISPVAKKWIKAIFQGRSRYVGKQKLIGGNQERYWSSCISPLSLLADDCSSLGGHSSCHHRPNSGNISSVHYNSRKIGLSHFHPFFLFFSSLFLVGPGKKSSLSRFWLTCFSSLPLFYLLVTNLKPCREPPWRVLIALIFLLFIHIVRTLQNILRILLIGALSPYTQCLPFLCLITLRMSICSVLFIKTNTK